MRELPSGELGGGSDLGRELPDAGNAESPYPQEERLGSFLAIRNFVRGEIEAGVYPGVALDSLEKKAGRTFSYYEPREVIELELKLGLPNRAIRFAEGVCCVSTYSSIDENRSMLIASIVEKVDQQAHGYLAETYNAAIANILNIPGLNFNEIADALERLSHAAELLEHTAAGQVWAEKELAERKRAEEAKLATANRKPRGRKSAEEEPDESDRLLYAGAKEESEGSDNFSYLAYAESRKEPGERAQILIDIVTEELGKGIDSPHLFVRVSKEITLVPDEEQRITLLLQLAKLKTEMGLPPEGAYQEAERLVGQLSGERQKEVRTTMLEAQLKNMEAIARRIGVTRGLIEKISWLPESYSSLSADTDYQAKMRAAMDKSFKESIGNLKKLATAATRTAIDRYNPGESHPAT